MKIRVNDQVVVTSGKDKGKKGRVTAVSPKKGAIQVEGVAMQIKHRKPQLGKGGERLVQQGWLAVSKVAILSATGERDRVGYQVSKDGEKIRVLRKAGTPVVTSAPIPSSIASKKVVTGTKSETKKTKKEKKAS